LSAPQSPGYVVRTVTGARGIHVVRVASIVSLLLAARTAAPQPPAPTAAPGAPAYTDPNGKDIGWTQGGSRAAGDACSRTVKIDPATGKQTGDPILGCATESLKPEVPKPFRTTWEVFGVGANIGLNVLLPAWGTGFNLAVSAGPSLRYGSWFYEGWHRVTYLQLDLDAAYRVLGERGGLWLASAGPVYQGWNSPVPTFKAQVFVSRSMEGKSSDHHNQYEIDAVGVSVSASFDFIICRPHYIDDHGDALPAGQEPTLDNSKRTFIFDDKVNREPKGGK
jgi:hypothetical protein